MDTIMRGSTGENLFSKYTYLFVDCNNSEICKQMNPCQARMKITLGRVYKNNNNLFIFFILIRNFLTESRGSALHHLKNFS
jgi:hypothetical protein